MIARVAQSCFWLHRYVERVDNTSRLLAVNFAFALDEPIGTTERWRPLLVVAGEEPTYRQKVGEAFLEDADRVLDYLTWDPDNPVSIRSSMHGARENARTIRETLSIEAWTALNRFWLWFESKEARRIYHTDPPVFFERLREGCHLFHGVCNDTLLHDEPFEFMRLGMYMERAGQTARILDIKYHALGPTRDGPESSAEAAEWIAILRSCSAYDPFFRRADGPLGGQAVTEFLLLDPAFPRSVRHCLERAWNFMQLIVGSQTALRVSPSARPLVELLTRVRQMAIDDVMRTGVHENLTDIIDRLSGLGAAIDDEFFAWGRPGAEPIVNEPREQEIQR